VAAIVKRYPEIARARLVVDNPGGNDRMTLHVEATLPEGGADNASSRAEAIVESIRDVTKLRGDVAFHAPGALANDGKVIDDQRKYE
jgi:phenylacetate-CoA ligase